MDTSNNQPKTIDEYINSFSEEVSDILQTIRQLIKEEAPDAVEAISYGMPTFKLNGKNLVHFAAWRDHISIYPTGSNLEESIPEVAKYRTGKGTLQFPLDKSMPLDLIHKIVKFRLGESRKMEV